MSTTEAIELRRAARRLAVSFAALMVCLILIVGAVVFGVVIAGQNESIAQSLVNAEHLDSPRDAAPGTYIAIVEGGHTLVSQDAPKGFPDESMLAQVSRDGRAAEATKTFDGRDFAVRTDSDSGRVVQVAVGRREGQEELQRLAMAFAAAALVAIIAAGFGAAWMSRRAMRPMAQALVLQRRFVTDASHELRTPLTLLSTRAQLLRRRVPTDDHGGLAEGVDELVQDAKSLTEILEDLLIAADPRAAAERTEVDLVAIADEGVGTMSAEAESRGISIVRTGARAPVVVTGARKALSRLVVAILANALDHARSDIVVDVGIHGTQAVIRVGDDGPGFPAELKERAFDRFASSRNGSDPGSEGGSGAGQEGASRHYGLGLALVAEVVARHGGAVSIDSSSLGGAEVVVRLPLSESQRD
ncbi:sensor histidine kinase [Rathayibacter sp. KR2-224]|uniref:sensor histidine kinase n=1 Tax=Rathayibacter sp. KR2-224 TaxID=3400913 RepID=UPI003C09D8BB